MTMLSNKQICEFIAKGVAVIDTHPSDEVHTSIHERIMHLNQGVRYPRMSVCNNLMAYIPELHQIVSCAPVKDTVSSILGSDYILAGHKALHPNYPNLKNRRWRWHQDKYFADYKSDCIPMKTPDHMPWALIGFYASSDILIEDLAPTHCSWGSQYSCDLEDWMRTDFVGQKNRNKPLFFVSHFLLRPYLFRLFPKTWQRVFSRSLLNRGNPIFLKKGQMAIMHHHLWHTATHNLTTSHRNLIKFEFIRNTKPRTGTWGAVDQYKDDGMPQAENLSSQNLVYRGVWRAMTGYTKDVQCGDIHESSEVLKAHVLNASLSEKKRMNAGYALALRSEKSDMEALFECLQAKEQNQAVYFGQGFGRRGYIKNIAALCLCGSQPKDGEHALALLKKALEHEDSAIRGYAVKVAANWGLTDPCPSKVIPCLVKLAQDSDAWVRGQVCVSLGRLTKNSPEAKAVMIGLLSDTNDFVRQYVSEALVGFKDFDMEQTQILSRALADPHRDVRYFILETLLRCGEKRAVEIAQEHLRIHYFCELSHRDMPF